MYEVENLIELAKAMPQQIADDLPKLALAGAGVILLRVLFVLLRAR